MEIEAVALPGVAANIVTDVANERGLPSNWLNDAALAYIPPVGPDDWGQAIRRSDVRVSIASVHMLLAMKLTANRGVRDSDDHQKCRSVYLERPTENRIVGHPVPGHSLGGRDER